VTYSSYVAIGDSFTEGVGDELPGGQVRGWADLVAIGLARAATRPVTYANLAIRGRLLAPLAGAQTDAAIALAPELLSINGGGNDLMRPRVTIDSIAERLVGAAARAAASGIHAALVSGANPRHIPGGRLVQKRGDQLAASVRGRLPLAGITFVDNWTDARLADLRYWSRDRLHLGPLGHLLVAENVLGTLGVPVPEFGADVGELSRPGASAYWREYVLPWIGRRLTGRSSGDQRLPKRATLETVDPV